MSRPKFVAILGPYSGGDTAVNVANAIGAAELLLRAGYVPFCPHLFHFWHMIHPHPQSDWLRLDREFYALCEVAIRLPGDSPGADEEEAWFKERGIPVYPSAEVFGGAFKGTIDASQVRFDPLSSPGEIEEGVRRPDGAGGVDREVRPAPRHTPAKG